MTRKGFIALELGTKALFEHIDGTIVSGFMPGSCLRPASGHTHFGVVLEGSVLLNYRGRRRTLSAGDYFSAKGPCIITGFGTGIVISSKGYSGMNVCGGPIEQIGRLRYINGSTDSLLIPPVRKGDPCLNHLHFPPQTVQTPHTHPTIRINVVFRGQGVCVLPEEDLRVDLVPGHVFIMLPETVHSFDTADTTMDVITFHPDSDVGVTDDDHPMVNRTFVNGQSASGLDSIRSPSSEAA